MSTCPSCGAGVSAEDARCPVCGASARWSEREDQAVPLVVDLSSGPAGGDEELAGSDGPAVVLDPGEAEMSAVSDSSTTPTAEGEQSQHGSDGGRLRRMARRAVPASLSAAPAERRRLRLVGLLATVVALVGIGGLGGWALRGTVGESSTRPVVVNVRSSSADAVAFGGRAMPSLAGLSEQDSIAALVAVGFGADRITVRRVPAAGPSGVVVGQDPSAGSSLRRGSKAVLRVSIPATVPGLVGKSETEAREALGELGARILRRAVYEASAAEGKVLATEPAAGAPLVDAITITVAAPPSSVFLASLDAVRNGCSSGSGSINGATFTDSLICSVNESGPTVVDFASNRLVTRLDATLGQSDHGETGFPVLVRIFADDRVVKEHTLAFGQSVDVSVPMTGVLRVRIEMIVPGEPPDCCGNGVEAVIASARFVGGPDAIDALVASSGNR